MRNRLRRFVRPLSVERTGDETPAASVWKYVWRMTGAHQVGVVVLALLAAGLNLAPLELQRRLVDGAIVGGDLQQLIWLGGVYVAVFVILRLVKLALRLYQGWLSESAIRYTRQHLIRIYAERDPAEDHGRPGEAVPVINAETDKLGGFVGEGISQAASNLAMSIGIIGYMLFVEPKVALFSLGVVVPQLLLAPFMQRRLNKLTQQRLRYLRDFGGRVAGEEVADDEQTRERLNLIYSNRIHFYAWKYVMKAILNLLGGLGPIVVLTYGGWLVIQGETTVGVLVAFLSGFERLSSPVRELITFYRQAEQARVQHDLIAQWMRVRIS